MKSKLNVLWYSLYDFGNSAFTTLVVTFIYSTYFTQKIAADATLGTVLWSRAVTVSALVIAVLSPILGGYADRSSRRASMMIVASVVCILATIGLAVPGEGKVMLALALFVIANVAYELGIVFYNSYLPDIANTESVGRISGLAWGMGYLGGLACLAVALVGFVMPDAAWFGLSKETGANIRATNVLAALWFLVFALPLMIKAPGIAPMTGKPGVSGRIGVLDTLKDLTRFPELLKFLVARMLFNDGLITVFAFGGIYAAGTFGMDFQQIIIFGIALNVAAGLGAFLFGFLDDRAGGKATVLISIVFLAVSAILAATARNLTMFWVAAIGIGLFAGPNQSASRSLTARFTPEAKKAQFFGFFAFSGKFTAFFGPLLLGFVTDITKSQRWGVATVVVFFLAGGLILLAVNEKKGIAQADIQK